jgi:hypothetical protein
MYLILNYRNILVLGKYASTKSHDYTVVFSSFIYRDYVSSHIQRVELGVTQEMEQYDTNFKVRQLLGNSKDVPIAVKEEKRDRSVKRNASGFGLAGF